jgi:hypothetical protein
MADLKYRRLGYKSYEVIHLGKVIGTLDYNSVTKWTAQRPDGRYRMHETYKPHALDFLLDGLVVGHPSNV